MNAKAERVIEGRILRIELLELANVRWSSDGWKTVGEVAAKVTGFGTYISGLPTQGLRSEEAVVFTIYWSERKPGRGGISKSASKEQRPVPVLRKREESRSQHQ